MANGNEVMDLTVIGGGPGGYVAALRAAGLGAKVAIIEADEVGGTCLNRGCIPSKALLHSAEVYEAVKTAATFGVIAQPPVADLPAMTKRMDGVISQLRKGIELLFKARNVRLIKAKGILLAADKVAARNAEGEEIISTKKIILASGSVPARVPIPGADSEGVITSNEILWLKEIPGSLVVIGGGAIGLEIGHLFATLGSKVTVFEMLPHILPTEDEEVTTELARSFKRRGIEVLAPAKVSKIENANGKKQVCYEYQEKSGQVEADIVLMATGRVPYYEGLGLDTLGIEMERRFVKTNARMETNVPGIYAIGDLIGVPQLAHKASAEGRIAVANALGHDEQMDYRAIPACVYTTPETASVGINAAMANEQGRKVKVGSFPFRALGKAVAIGERTGFVKLVADADTNVLIGAQMIGPHVTDLIAEAVLAIQMGLTAQQVAETIHAHPTLAEPTQEAAEDILGMAIHK
jgi:dihydrolipoamide dehydrogenase